MTLLNEEKISELMDQLIVDYKYSEYDQLDDIDKQSLATLAMEVLGADAFSLIFYDDKLDSVLDNVIEYMKLSDLDNAAALSDCIKKNVLEHFDTYFGSLFAHRYAKFTMENDPKYKLEYEEIYV